MISKAFLQRFKLQTEHYWAQREINPIVYGFQIQRGTRWNDGLTETEITDYEGVLNVRFPEDFRLMLSVMNGTDLPTINVYGHCGEPFAYGVGVYSYPRDLDLVKERMELVQNDAAELSQELCINFPSSDRLVPIFAHRYVVCRLDPSESPVVSIMDLDAVYYGDNLQNYLLAEFGRS